MKKLIIAILTLFLVGNMAFAGQYPTQNYKLNQYNNRGQKVGYTKVYYSNNDKSNVKKVEKYNTKGKRVEVYR